MVIYRSYQFILAQFRYLCDIDHIKNRDMIGKIMFVLKLKLKYICKFHLFIELTFQLYCKFISICGWIHRVID